MKLHELRRVIREILAEIAREGTHAKKPKRGSRMKTNRDKVRRKDVLGEPDYTEDGDENDEASGAGAVAGAVTPLGTDATGKHRKKKKK